MKKLGVVTCKSPSNIALVKYWGKKPVQIPANPSISFSLTNCTTETSISLEENFEKSSGKYNFSFEFEGQPKPEFHEKIEIFLSRVESFIPHCLQHTLVIKSRNTFPHSSGIASSASSMSALAGCLFEWERILTVGQKDASYYRNISEMSRLGSGSAARSIAGGFSFWGKYDAFPESSDRYAVPVTVHDHFNDIQDTILLVDQGVKEVSSTIGHNLMNNHPFATQRFVQANDNISRLLAILSSGSFMDFADLVEQEALSLHAMMLTSNPSYILFKPNTISIIEEIRAERKRSGLAICFTLDAGANVHVLYPKRVINSALAFIEDKLVGFCENGAYICDEVGGGQEIITELNA